MSIRDPAFQSTVTDHRGGRRHRFMESSDTNAAFRELFKSLRANIRQGLTNKGQVYAIEMDACIPGELLGTRWIPPVTRGIEDPASLSDARCRRALFDRLLAEPGPEALFAYVCESADDAGPARLYLEVVSADAAHAAEYPIRPGQGWHHRDLTKVRHHRLGANDLG
jgi:hypothetical protein